MKWRIWTQDHHHAMQVPTVGDNEEAQGDDLAGIVGVRISTPIFGTGFNFCVGKHAPAILTGSSGYSCPAVIGCMILNSETGN